MNPDLCCYDFEIVDPIDGWHGQCGDFAEAVIGLRMLREQMAERGDDPAEAYITARVCES